MLEKQHWKKIKDNKERYIYIYGHHNNNIRADCGDIEIQYLFGIWADCSIDKMACDWFLFKWTNAETLVVHLFWSFPLWNKRLIISEYKFLITNSSSTSIFPSRYKKSVQDLVKFTAFWPFILYFIVLILTSSSGAKSLAFVWDEVFW